MTRWPPTSASHGGQELLFGRFEVLELLGSGGSGQVSLCRDRDSGEIVALKQLHRLGPDAVLGFKKEFRALSDVQHPNLVRLGELLEEDGRWAITLEYVPGTDALSWVRHGAGSLALDTLEHAPRSSREDALRAEPHGGGFDEQRLRALLVQLVHGLTAIHAMGLLHRDVKPENVRVTPEGRAVLLDFGLVTDAVRDALASDVKVVGTVAYMAPEQAAGHRLGPAADWYAVGTMLYEALTGRLPFSGGAVQVLLAKQRELPPRPASLCGGVPADLDDLCMRLLAISPDDRPDAEAVLRQVSGASATSIYPSAATTRSDELFVGRERELAILRAQAALAADGIRLAVVEGESGIGKSALVERFAADEARAGAMVLRGRCHAAELLGYKAFDNIVDELTRHLKELPDHDVVNMLPQEAHLLPVLFPVLARVTAIARRMPPARPARVQRYPSFEAFSELLLRSSARRRVLLVIDDLQWADEASLVLLGALLDSAHAPKVLVIATVRPLDTLDGAGADKIRELCGHTRATRVGLSALDDASSHALAGRLARAWHSERFIAQLAQESGGHPLFLGELLRYAESRGREETAQVELDDAIVARIAELDDTERLLLARSAAAGGPLPYEVLRASTDAQAEALRHALGTLRVHKLLRTVRRNETIVFHDRIREAVLRTMDTEALARHHRALAVAWESRSEPAPALLARHWLECGERERAVPWLERAAYEANATGAFERAAEHYRVLLEHVREPAQRHVFALALSEALANAGRCAESAHVLLGALEGASESEAVELSIRAAQRLLQAGKVAEGLLAAERAFAHLGIPWPKTSTRALWRILWHRAQLGMRGFEVPERPAVTALQLAELDALRRLLLPTVWADLLRSVELGSRHVRLALRTAEPDHLAHALCWQASIFAVQQRDPELVARLFERAAVARKSVRKPELEAHETYMRGTAAMMRGDFAETEARYETAERILREHCPGAAWELVNARGGLLGAWVTRGKFRLQTTSAQAWIDEAKLRGDRFARASYSVGGLGVFRLLMRDAPELALAEIEEVMEPWRTEGVGAQHFMQAVAIGGVLCYMSGKGSAEHWAAEWPHISRSFLFRMPFMRDSLVRARLGTVLARAFADHVDAATLREARSLRRALGGGRGPLGKGWARILEAQLALLEGDRARAEALATEARERFEAMSHVLVRWADVLAARASGAADTLDRERRLLDFIAEEGALKPEGIVIALMPAAQAWR